MLGLVGIFSNSSTEENVKSGLAIKYEGGTVYITRETFESIILNVTKDFASLRNVKVLVNIDFSNIEEAIQVNPYCIDVSSGVETDRYKDREKILALVKRVRGK